MTAQIRKAGEHVIIESEKEPSKPNSGPEKSLRSFRRLQDVIVAPKEFVSEEPTPDQSSD